MARAVYTEYVNHCMRFYTRHSKLNTNNLTDILNWQACEKALDKFSLDEQEILTFIYRERNTMANNVYNISKQKRIKQNTIWNLIGKLELEIAKIRGLM